MDIKELKEEAHKIIGDKEQELDCDLLYEYLNRVENKEIDEDDDFYNFAYKVILYNSLNEIGPVDTFELYPKTLKYVEEMLDEFTPRMLLDLSSYYEEQKDYDNYFKCLEKGAHSVIRGATGGFGLVDTLINIDYCRFYLAQCFMEGIGTEKDYIEAFNLLYFVMRDHLLQKHMADPITDEFLKLYQYLQDDFKNGKNYPGLDFVLGIMSADGLGPTISMADLNEFMYLGGIYQANYFQKNKYFIDYIDQSLYYINIKPITKKLKKGDFVEYNRYNHRLIVWKVLDIKDDKALLISRDVLESTYIAERRGIDNCYNNFVSDMLSFEEDDINVGKPFILSREEVIKYMHRLEARKGGVRYQASINGFDNSGSTSAYFTSTQYKDDDYYFVDEDGYIGIDNIQRNYIGLRPAIWIKLTDDYHSH